jgi:hypothetical protein
MQTYRAARRRAARASGTSVARRSATVGACGSAAVGACRPAAIGTRRTVGTARSGRSCMTRARGSATVSTGCPPAIGARCTVGTTRSGRPCMTRARCATGTAGSARCWATRARPTAGTARCVGVRWRSGTRRSRSVRLRRRFRSATARGRSRLGSGRAVLLAQRQRWDRYDQQKRNKLSQNVCFLLAELHCGLLTINAHFDIGDETRDPYLGETCIGESWHRRIFTSANCRVGNLRARTYEPHNDASLTGGGGPLSQTCIHAGPGAESLSARHATRNAQSSLATQRWIRAGSSSRSGGGRTLPEVARPRNCSVGSAHRGFFFAVFSAVIW